jgi:hypothetical protein
MTTTMSICTTIICDACASTHHIDDRFYFYFYSLSFKNASKEFLQILIFFLSFSLSFIFFFIVLLVHSFFLMTNWIGVFSFPFKKKTSSNKQASLHYICALHLILVEIRHSPKSSVFELSSVGPLKNLVLIRSS